MCSHNICFYGEIKYQYFWADLFKGILIIILNFIDHQSKMTQIDSLEFHFLLAYKNKT